MLRVFCLLLIRLGGDDEINITTCIDSGEESEHRDQSNTLSAGQSLAGLPPGHISHLPRDKK